MGAIKLSPADWSSLVKTVEVTLGDTTIEVKPIGLDQMPLLIDNINAVLVAAVDQGLTLANIDERPFDLFRVLLAKAPAFLEALTGIDRDDITRLPVAKSIELLSAVVEVNLADPKALADNVKSLTSLVGRIDAGMVAGVIQ